MESSRVTELSRVILLYAILVGGLPVLQAAALLSGMQTETTMLLALYFFVPLAGVWLVRRGHPRPGAILLLGFMSSGIVFSALLFHGLNPPAYAPPIWIALLRLWILVLIVVQAATGWFAFWLLREVHRSVDSSNQAPHS